MRGDTISAIDNGWLLQFSADLISDLDKPEIQNKLTKPHLKHIVVKIGGLW